ncbi:histidine phosphatase family protein [Lacticaseibacillus casei]|uniref:histidine phosphatase family protein n=1 Tax=Lacticaseibacillus TaxID=2759736 RepID=UPI000668105B|nr:MULTISPECIES: histidine phosphatase family protein [Lacticaseibacillus]QVI36765.1 histidine phosphatase family protein [Lacticaseibacillus casei]QXG58555.1 histidine phosphatase family protein [Lacticaseibacillus casei]WFB41703.1 histidine phosphatase family protein [Lacticaseibacillus huelsenbergensis]
MTTLYLVRHGQTEFNVQKRVQGMADSALTAKGIADAKALGLGFKTAGIRFNAAFASDLTRAIDTAHFILSGLDEPLPVTTLMGLREENYGKFKGQLANDFSLATMGVANFHKALANREITLAQTADAAFAANMDQHPNTAETNRMVQERLNRTLRAIAVEAETKDWQRVLVVTHGTAALMWLNYIHYNIDGREMLDNASVTKLSWTNERFRVTDFNDLGFLHQGQKVAGEASA